ncbi:MAG TPA: endopeptidase La [Firmicutes bacterium]|nr:endopeptidase La [Bacillota bacterium]
MPNADKRFILVPCDGAVVFPGHLLSFNINAEGAVRALMQAVETNREVFFSYCGGEPSPDTVSRVGTLARIKQLIKNSRGGLSVIALGLTRMEIGAYISTSPLFEVTLAPFPEKQDDPIMLIAVKNAVRAALDRSSHISPKLLEKEPSLDDLDDFVGEMAAAYYDSDEERQALLELPSRYEQLHNILFHIERQCELASLQKDIEVKVRKSIDKSQHEYYLREQIKVLHRELGDDEDELESYRSRLADKKLPDYAREKAEKEIAKMSRMSPTSPESAVSRGYLDLILELPWEEETEEKNDLSDVRRILDEDHYGLEKVKRRIVEYLAVCALKKDMKAPILCFVGPPGVGKTSIVRSIARAAGRRLVTMSLGGVRDEAEIRGHRRTYIGSLPGRIISGMRDAGVRNPVFLLDEIDKMSSDFRGDPSSALLEVLDANQNDKFKDHYLEMPYDLSHVMFVTTANSIDTIDPPLLDRMEVIELTGYTFNEKLEIAKKYLVPKQCEANGVPAAKVSFTDEALVRIAQRYTRESGVRNLEREIGSVIRKIAVSVAEGKKKRVYKITADSLPDYLGKEKFSESESSSSDAVGEVTGLAWTSAGGTTLDVEVAVLPGGKGEVKLTGNLGDVMKESAMTAMSLVRSRAESLGIDPAVFGDCDVHIHVPEGATPKDGPSAGITLATAIASALSGRPAAGDAAMTGEVTLRGKVLAIGGLKEKSLAALRSGKKRLIIPRENEKDMDEIPAEVKEHVTVLPVSTVDEVFALALR